MRFQSLRRKKVPDSLPYRLLIADAAGTMSDDPQLRALFQQGDELIIPDKADWMPLPSGAGLISLPGRSPLGLDPQGEIIEVEGATAVAATLPQGYTRLAIPAFETQENAPELPLYGYAAVAWHEDEVWVAAHPTDDLRDRWDPKHFNTADLESLIVQRMAEFPHNRIIEQLAHCALEYKCFTAQNMFYRRWEAGIPVSPICNARCLGCISLQESECCPSPQTRLAFVPTVDEIVSIGSAHLQHAEDAMISFGQGCEGEPSLQWRTLVPAIQKIRERTLKGTINMNSNAGNTEAIRSLAQNGLDAIRVSLNSTRPELYHAYYRPVAYQFSHVLESMRACQENAVQLSFNLLAFPGITDREREVESLLKVIKEFGVRMVQLRNLNIDPILYWETMAVSNARDGKALGMLKLIEILQKETDVLVGSFSRSKNFLQN